MAPETWILFNFNGYKFDLPVKNLMTLQLPWLVANLDKAATRQNVVIPDSYSMFYNHRRRGTFEIRTHFDLVSMVCDQPPGNADLEIFLEPTDDPIPEISDFARYKELAKEREEFEKREADKRRKREAEERRLEEERRRAEEERLEEERLSKPLTVEQPTYGVTSDRIVGYVRTFSCEASTPCPFPDPTDCDIDSEEDEPPAPSPTEERPTAPAADGDSVKVRGTRKKSIARRKRFMKKKAAGTAGETEPPSGSGEKEKSDVGEATPDEGLAAGEDEKTETAEVNERETDGREEETPLRRRSSRRKSKRSWSDSWADSSASVQEETDATAGRSRRPVRTPVRGTSRRRVTKKVLTAGDSFPSKEDLVEAVADYCIQEGFNVLVTKSEPHRYTARCKREKCTWRISASDRRGSEGWWTIVSVGGDHVDCPFLEHNPMATTVWMGKKLKSDFENDPTLKVNDMKEILKSRFGIVEPDRTVYKARLHILGLLREAED